VAKPGRSKRADVQEKQFSPPGVLRKRSPSRATFGRKATLQSPFPWRNYSAIWQVDADGRVCLDNNR
jgi:hypothetical protein